MTPRSRCPIIINSSTSLSSEAIPEENSQTPALQNTRQLLTASEENLHTPFITNTKALLSSPPEAVQPQTFTTIGSSSSLDSITKLSEADPDKENCHKQPFKEAGETKLSRWGSSTLRRTLSSASSTTSLFGSFFRHLSTTSLSQLATKLTSATSVHSTDTEEKEREEEEECDAHNELDESLSSVFKGYLLSRSILTDSPVDLSMLYIDDEANEIDVDLKEEIHLGSKSDSDNEDELGDSAYESSHPPSKTTSRQCSKASLNSLDSAQDLYTGTELSDSLLFCLDGHDPSRSASSVTEKCAAERKRLIHINEAQNHSTLAQELSNDSEHSSGLHSCSPEGRCHSLLKTKQGTPVPQRESNHSVNGSACGVLFETSF